MDLKELIHLVEQGPQDFYVHLIIEGQKKPAELYWLDSQWQFRPFAYSGEWTSLPSPVALAHLFDQNNLKAHMSDFLLTEFYYYETFNIEDKVLRKKIIQKFFGQYRCDLYIMQMKAFQESLASMVKKCMKPKIGLVPEDPA